MVDAPPFAFVRRVPPAPLDRVVEAVWYAHGTTPWRRERIAPTGSTVAVVVLGDAILETPDDGRGPTLRAEQGFLLGPHDRPVVNEPTGVTHAVGIVTTPVGCRAVLGLSPTEHRGRAQELGDHWPATAGLRDQLRDVDDAEVVLGRVVHHLATTVDLSVPGLARCEHAVALLEADPTRPIADIAEEVGVSHGQLDRDVKRVVGLTPRVLARLLRMRRLLEALDVHGEVAWSGHAHDLGWYDQAHLIRDFRRHTGVTPSAYLAAQRAADQLVDPTAAAGFVPQQ